MTCRRVIILAVVYLLCGLVVNVLVAWGCAVGIATPPVPPAPPWAHPATHQYVWVDSSSGVLCVADAPPDSGQYVGSWGSFYVRSALGKEEVHLRFSWPRSRNTGDLAMYLPRWAYRLGPEVLDQGDAVRLNAAGWPRRALVSYEAPPSGGTGSQWAIDLGSAGTSWDQLPLRPIWPGALWNTLFYAAILVGLHQGFIAIKLTRRRRRGLCPRCKYDLRGGEPGIGCSECGWRRPA